MVVLRLGTDVPSGIVIADWSFVLPWECHIDWDYDACDVIPKRDQPAYEQLFKSRLTAKLNERRLLTRGRPIEGLLCGRIFEQIPEPFARAATVSAELSVTDTTGYTTSLPVSLWMCRSAALLPKARSTKRKARLFDKPDIPVVASSSYDVMARPVPNTDKAAPETEQDRSASVRDAHEHFR